MNMNTFELNDLIENHIERVDPKKYQSTTCIGLEHLQSDSFKIIKSESTENVASQKLAFKKGDVLFAKRRTYQRKVGIATIDGIISTDAMVLRPNTKIMSEAFLPFFIRSDAFMKEAIRNSNGSLSPRVNWSSILNKKFSIPNLEKQNTLAELLWKLEKINEAYKTRLTLYSELVKSRFIEMFEEQNIGEWDRRCILSVCSDPDDIKCGPFGTQLSKDEYVSEGIAVWGIPEINSGLSIQPSQFITPEKADKLSAYELRSGDIVMSRKGNVGMCSVFPSNYCPGIIHSDAIRIRVDPAIIEPVFLMYELHYSQYVRKQILDASSGAIMPGTNVTKLKKMSIFVPPIEVQRVFVDFVNQIDKLKKIIARRLQATKQLQSSIINQSIECIDES